MFMFSHAFLLLKCLQTIIKMWMTPLPFLLYHKETVWLHVYLRNSFSNMFAEILSNFVHEISASNMWLMIRLLLHYILCMWNHKKYYFIRKMYKSITIRLATSQTRVSKIKYEITYYTTETPLTISQDCNLCLYLSLTSL